MTVGARSGLLRLHREHGHEVTFVSVAVREAHPGELAPAHASFAQKLEQTRRWAREDPVPWAVAVDDVEGTVHRRWGPLPNSVHLVGSTGHVAFRALWAGQPRVLRRKLRALLAHERRGDVPVDLGESTGRVVPLLHGSPELSYALGRGGRKAIADFRRALGPLPTLAGRLLRPLRGAINPGNRDLPARGSAG